MNDDRDIVIAILAKQKEYCLDFFLRCILTQTWPKNRTHLYIRTNNNTDQTVSILDTWLKQYGHMYKKIFYDSSDVAERVQDYAPHEWNALRFKVLAQIRQDSITYAIENQCHYFVVDCDNYIFPSVLEHCYQSHLNVMGPMLIQPFNAYSNFHNQCDTSGYLKSNSQYYTILNRQITGYIEVDVIHCTYFIRHSVLSEISYFDGTGDYEYVIFSRNLRKKKIRQYLSNLESWGYISIDSSREELLKKNFMPDLCQKLQYRPCLDETKKYLILCPNAGLGNRLRSICTGILMAKKLDRQFYLYWPSMNPIDPRENVKAMQKVGWQGLFESTLPLADKTIFPYVDIYYSEWVNGDFWFSYQNLGKREWNLDPVSPRLSSNLDHLKTCQEQVILIETSLDCVNETDKNELFQIYREYFKPLSKYMDRIKNCGRFDVGISIRKGDLKLYFAEANQNEDEIIRWIKELKTKYKVCIFSDDHNFKDVIRKDLEIKVDIDYIGLDEWELGFVDFLCLSYNCDIICGTPKSSFAEQASIFSNKPYYENLKYFK